ncbi:MAG: hypothetical protein MJA29_10815 [Candidatus Omnitrophica bacterium]|nr:hypothetical protein [Candidatus Omnitrophota bacterium]
MKLTEVMLVIMIIVLGALLFGNESVRKRVLDSNSVLIENLSKIRRAMGSVMPAGRYGITKETTQVELAKRLSDILLQGSYDEGELRVIVRELRRRADFVLVGTIDTIQVLELTNDYDTEGEFAIGVEVAAVERGMYPYDYIDVSAGYYASWLPFPVYPPHIRTSYKRSDTVRIYVADDPDYGYILTGGFFGIEPRAGF